MENDALEDELNAVENEIDNEFQKKTEIKLLLHSKLWQKLLLTGLDIDQ